MIFSGLSCSILKIKSFNRGPEITAGLVGATPSDCASITKYPARKNAASLSGSVSGLPVVLNTQCKAGLVDVHNDAFEVRVKNKAFIPFVACCSVDENGGVQLNMADAFNYRKSIEGALYGSGDAYDLANYRFSEAVLNGSLCTDTGLLAAMLACAANRFFSQSSLELQVLSVLEFGA